MLKDRVRKLNSHNYQSGPIVYWMVRDQRAVDNWALLYAQRLARKFQQPLLVVFSLRSNLINHHGTTRMLTFMLNGLEEVEQTLKQYHIPFFLITTETQPHDAVSAFVKKHSAGAVISDFSPLAEQLTWKKTLAASLKIPVFEVDSHNIIPCWVASEKQEFAAYTFRPKIYRKIHQFLDEFPALSLHTQNSHQSHDEINWAKVRDSILVDDSVASISWLSSGTKAGYKKMQHFFASMSGYKDKRNDPNTRALSDLSAYLHFGQISAQRVALEAKKHNSILLNPINQELSAPKLSSLQKNDLDTFLEELIVRRELSDNFCFYNQNYKSMDAFPTWAKKTLDTHRQDKRTFVYTLSMFEHAQTDDPLWNAAQLEMVTLGKMHGYLRMYWAKKILEWTPSPEIALQFAIHLNDKYSIDGRDPNGYVGILWSIGGVHDRPWFERPVFGLVRYMNASGAKKKFDVQKYINKYITTQ